MESEEAVSVKREAIEEILTTTEYNPACKLCSRAGPDLEAVLKLDTKASVIHPDVLLPNTHIKKEQEDISDQKIVEDLLAVRKFCGGTKEEEREFVPGFVACKFCSCTEEEERELIARLIAEADGVSADHLLSDTPIKKEPEDTKDQQVIEDLLGCCKLCDIEDKELALALQPVHSNVEESTRHVSGNSRSVWDAIKQRSGVCAEPVAHKAEKCTTQEAEHCETAGGPVTVPDGKLSGGGSYTCSLCAETFSSKYTLVKHVFVHISGVPPPPHICKRCGDVFTSGRSLRRHLRQCECSEVAECGVAPTAEERKHYNTRRNASNGTAERVEGKVCSKACGLSSSARSDTKAEDSEQKCHSDSAGKSQQSAFKLAVQENWLIRGRPHSCFTCHKSFFTSSDLKRHQSVHMKNKPYKCMDCGKRFRRADHLRKHGIMHSEKVPYTCSVCGKSFKRLDTLKKHGLVHTELRLFSCGDCGKTFKSRGGLLVHTRSHIGYKPYKCEDCGAAFTRAHSLLDHKRLHSGERPFECSVCRATFNRAVTLREHMRVHTGEKPYSCDICGVTFGHASAFRKHKQISYAERLPKCDNCSKSFETDSVLKELGVVGAEKSLHQCSDCGKSFIQAVGLSKRPYKCGYCGQVFCHISAIKRHARVHRIRRYFECDKCGITYDRSDYLLRHQKSGSCKPNNRGKSFRRGNIQNKLYKCDDCGNVYTRIDSFTRHRRIGSCKSKNRSKS